MRALFYIVVFGFLFVSGVLSNSTPECPNHFTVLRPDTPSTSGCPQNFTAPDPDAGICAEFYPSPYCEGGNYSLSCMRSGEFQNWKDRGNTSFLSLQLNPGCLLRICLDASWHRCAVLYGGWTGKSYSLLPWPYNTSISTVCCTCGWHFEEMPSRCSITSCRQLFRHDFFDQRTPERRCAALYGVRNCIGRYRRSGYDPDVVALASLHVYPGCSLKANDGRQVLTGGPGGRYDETIPETFDRRYLNWTCTCDSDFLSGCETMMSQPHLDYCAIAYEAENCNANAGKLIINRIASQEWTRGFSSLLVAPGCELAVHTTGNLSRCDISSYEEHILFPEGAYSVLPRGSSTSMMAMHCKCANKSISNTTTDRWDISDEEMPATIPNKPFPPCAVIGAKNDPDGPKTWIPQDSEGALPALTWDQHRYLYVRTNNRCAFGYCTHPTGHCGRVDAASIGVIARYTYIISYKCFCNRN